jgi:fatty-acyl-CoA synthase
MDMPENAHSTCGSSPMFHRNGCWKLPWTVAAARAGVNVCLRKVEAKAIDSTQGPYATHSLRRSDRARMLVNARTR